MAPLISVILPVWNGERFLEEALATIRAQEDPRLEVILVDDGSTDGTAAIAAAHPEVQYHRQTNQGPAAARNHGLKLAQGELIAFLDVDDLWPAGKLERQRAKLEEDPALDVVLGRVQYHSLEDALEMPIRFEGADRTTANVHLGCGLYRRRAFDRVGGFDASMRCSEDQDWFLRAREASLRLKILEDVMLIYRLHGGNMTRGAGLKRLQVLEALRKSIERRRETGKKDLGHWRDLDEKRPPLVSVIIPAYNGERFIAQAIDSLLNQSYDPLEIIVVNDGSTDGTTTVVARYPSVRLIEQKNGGVASARNHGVREAKGELVSFLDQDDRRTEGSLKAQVRLLQQRPEIELVMGRQRIELEPGIERPSWLKEELIGPSQAGYNLGCILVRKQAIERVGTFDETHHFASDVDWFFRMKDLQLPHVTTEDVVMRHRVHDQNESHQVAQQHPEYVQLARRSILRMRELAAMKKQKEQSTCL